MRIGIASDHGGFELKALLSVALKGAGHEIVDFGAKELDPEDDYSDFVVSMARAVASGKVLVAWLFAKAGWAPILRPIKSPACAQR